MAKNMNGMWAVVAVLVVLGGIAFLGTQGTPGAATGGIGAPAQPSTPAGASECSTSLTGNPGLSIIASASDGQGGSKISNQFTVALFGTNGVSYSTATSSSGTATFSTLPGNTDFYAEITPVSGTTAFYALRADNLRTCASGTRTVSVTYQNATTTAPTLTVTNGDASNTTNSNSAAKAIAAGDAGTYYGIRVRPASSTTDFNGFGDGVAGVVFAVDYNNLAVESLSMTGPDGTQLGTLGNINGWTREDVNKLTTAFFVAKENQLRPGTDYDYRLFVTASASQEPVAVSGTDDEMYVTVLDATRVLKTAGNVYGEYYINPNTPSSAPNIGSANGTSSLHYS